MPIATRTKPTLDAADIDILRNIFATKDDVKDIFKEETKQFATKGDVKQFATKGDVNQLVTQDYLDKTLDEKLAPIKKRH